MLGEALLRALAAGAANGRLRREPARVRRLQSFAVDGEPDLAARRTGGDCFAFHASTDGTIWQLVRYFAFDDPAGISVGFEAQSPTGEGCRVSFDEIHYEAGRLTDLRSGG